MAFAFLVALAMAPQMVEGPVRVVDGDTLRMGEHRIRLQGIDAPESRQTCARNNDPQWPCGKAATEALRAHIADQNVRCAVEDQDRYRRLVARCYVGAQDINGWMVSEGWALAYRQYSQAYVTHEAQARAAKQGVWGTNFTLPWQWRAERRRRH